MIETKDLTKTFDNFTAVDSLNLKIEKGEFFGLLGPNGAYYMAFAIRPYDKCRIIT